MNNSKITFMNEISNRIFSVLANVKNFLKGDKDLLDMKLLYVYQKKAKKEKKLKSFDSIIIKNTYSHSQDFSLRQIAEMSV